MKAILYSNFVILVYLFLLPLVGFAQRAGGLDRTFNYGMGENYEFNFGYGANDHISKIIPQPDGKLLIGGQFLSRYNSQFTYAVVRLNPDGSLDSSFNISNSVQAQSNTSTFALQPDGKILLGGKFNVLEGSRRVERAVVRLHSNGTLDTSFRFNATLYTQVNIVNDIDVYSIVCQPNGKILVGGDFVTNSSSNYKGILRVNANGTFDSTFYTRGAEGGFVISILLQSDNKILVAGNFSQFNGLARNRIVRLNSDGTEDLSFSINGMSSWIRINSMVLQPDNKLLIGGTASSFSNSNNRGIIRLNSNGSRDQTFIGAGVAHHSSNYATVASVDLQSDGKIVIGGSFYSYNGVSRRGVARINSDGSIDATFNLTFNYNSIIYLVYAHTNNRTLIGKFREPINEFEDEFKRGLICVNNQGNIDSTFNRELGSSGIIGGVSLQENGKIIITGNFNKYNGVNINNCARLNSDGSLDRSTPINLPSASTNPRSFTCLPDGKFLTTLLIDHSPGYDRRYLFRLNANGSIDNTFTSSEITGDGGHNIAIQPDGKIIIAGGFNSFNGIPRNKIIRLNANGTFDSTFYTPHPIALNGDIYCIAIQPDGKIFIGGYFENGPYSTYNNGLVRLLPNGRKDPSFNSQYDKIVYSIGLRTNGKLVISTTVNPFSQYSRNTISWLNSDGSIGYESYNFERTTINRIGDSPLSVVVQPDQKVLLVGKFTLNRGTQTFLTGRFKSNGSIDSSFTFGIGNEISGGVIQPDGKLIIYGLNSINQKLLIKIGRISLGDCTIPQTPSISGNPVLCLGGSVVLTSSSPIRNIWSTGDTTQSITVSSIGNYTVKVYSGACISSNSVPFVVSNPTVPIPTIQGNQYLCNRNPAILTSSSIGGNIWSTGDTTASISVYEVGEYSVQVVSGGCTTASSNEFVVSELSWTYLPTIFGDQELCAGSFSTLTSSYPTGNLWSTGDTTRSINVSAVGTYTVRNIISNCTSEASAPFVVVQGGPSLSSINFSATDNTCLGTRIQLTPTGTFDYYYWNNGERTRSIYTRTSGQYSIQVANSDSCFGLPSPPIFIAFDTNWCSVEIFRLGVDSITANVWADYFIWYLDGNELLTSNTLKTIPIQGDGVYTFRAVTGGRTSPLSNPIVITSARKSINAPKLKLYPNPTSGIVNLNTSPEAERIAITNAVGQVVYTTKAQPEMELNLSHLKTGVYMVQVQSIKGVSTQRLVIQ